MLDFGEELTAGTFKIPWLIWIQILILLLMILLYCFSISPLDLSAENNNHSNFSAFPSSSNISNESQMKKPVFKQNTTIRNRVQPSQRGETQSIKGEIATGTSRRRIEEINTTAERERTSAKEAAANSMNYHPCHYFRLARIAFLKCLGLDSENSISEQNKR